MLNYAKVINLLLEPPFIFYYCLYPLLPPVRSQLEHLRSRGHDFILPSCTKDLSRDFSSCVVCLVLCYYYIVSLYCFIVLHTHSEFASSFMFLLLLYVLSHMRLSVCHVPMNITYLLVGLHKTTAWQNRRRWNYKYDTVAVTASAILIITTNNLN